MKGTSGLLLLALLAGPVEAAERYDPRLTFRTLRTPHFTIHFHQGEDHLAQRLAQIAEEVHDRLSRELQVSPERHTHVILVDQTDLANGWATPVPYNLIEITAAAPPPSSDLGFTDDWLRLVFTHEYTHVLHLDRSRGLFGALRRVFGRAAPLFPNVFLPLWHIEGLATFYETRETGAGRLRSGAFRSIVDTAAREDAFLRLDRAAGGLVDWPGGNAAYVYGARFHEYLEARFGRDAFARLSAATAGRVPYLPGGAYRKVFGTPVRELWQEFRRSTEATARENDRSAAPATRLTHQGFTVAGPRWLPDGGLLYSSRTPHGFPALMHLAPGGTPRTLLTRYLGERASPHRGLVFFDQQELVRSVALQSDLYVADLTTGRVQRLTTGARAADPDVSPDGSTLAAIRQANGSAALVRYPIARAAGRLSLGDPLAIVDRGDTQFGAPRWSPSGHRLAAERRSLGARPDVVILDPTTGEVRQRIAAGDGRVGEPEWVDESRLLVTFEQADEPPAVVRVDLATGRVTRVVDLPGGAQSPACSSTGRIAFVGSTADGYDLFETPLIDGDPEPRVEVGLDVPPRSGEASTGRPAMPYSPARSVWPRFWMPVVETDEDRLEAGAGTLGFDALGRHTYTSVVLWSDRARPDWNVSYAYDRWRPTIVASAADDVIVWQGQEYRETSVDAGLLLPFRTVRRRQFVYAAFHGTRERDPGGVFDRRSIRAGYQVSSARRYGYSISPEDGVTAGATVDVTRRALGADADALTWTVDLRAYPRVGGRHRVLALRAAAAVSSGDRAGRRALGAGGSAAPASTLAFGRDAIGLARGFGTDDIAGSRAAVLNADYRLPLARIERGLGRLPIFLRQVHATAFVDAAHAWTSAFDAADARVSGGVELSADFVLGHSLPLTVASGLAFRRDPAGAQEGPAAFWRLGVAF